MYCFFFFFSSRRRHTRLQGDWSSDVCSSDLSFDAQSPNAPGLADIIDAAYLPVDTPVTGYNARMAQLTHLFADPSRDQLLNTLRTRQAEVWSYRFDWARQPAPWNTVYGAAHAFDLPFLFGNFGPSVFSRVTNSTANAPGRLALSNAMMASLKAFMQTGNPQIGRAH